jgi:hypothetical protein
MTHHAIYSFLFSRGPKCNDLVGASTQLPIIKKIQFIVSHYPFPGVFWQRVFDHFKFRNDFGSEDTFDYGDLQNFDARSQSFEGGSEALYTLEKLCLIQRHPHIEMY